MITCKFEDGGKAELRHVVVHAIVEKDGKLLLEKRAESLCDGSGQWCLPGGFMDRDETVKQAVLRELLEETGWEGEIIAFFRVNTNPQRQEKTKRQNVALEFIIKPLKQIKSGDKNAINFLVGQVLRKTNFKADPNEVRKRIGEKIN